MKIELNKVLDKILSLVIGYKLGKDSAEKDVVKSNEKIRKTLRNYRNRKSSK